MFKEEVVHFPRKWNYSTLILLPISILLPAYFPFYFLFRSLQERRIFKALNWLDKAHPHYEGLAICFTWSLEIWMLIISKNSLHYNIKLVLDQTTGHHSLARVPHKITHYSIILQLVFSLNISWSSFPAWQFIQNDCIHNKDVPSFI